MADFIVTRKLRITDEVLKRGQFGKMSPITERILRESRDKSLLMVLDPDPAKAAVASCNLMREYLKIK